MAASLPEGCTLRWLERIDELQALEAEWQALAERTGAEVYLRPAWLLTWWRHFGTDRQLACLALRREGRLAGLLPFAIEELRAGPLPLRLARLAGTDPHCIVFQAPLEPDLAAPVWRLAVRHLLRKLGCDALSLTPVSDRTAHLPLLREIGASEPGLALHEAAAGRHVVFDLAKNFETWLARLSKNRRSHFRRRLRELQSRHAMQAAETIPDSTEFAEFAAFHDRQWRAVGRGGHFTDWPGSRDFYQDLAGRPAAEPPIRLYPLTGAEGLLASRFVLRAAGRAHFRLPARSLDPEVSRLSIGEVSLITSIEQLTAQKVDMIEAGRGDYDYKLSCGGTQVPVWQILLYPDTPRGRGRLRILLGWSRLLNLLYYRIWFLKLAPRLQRRFGRRPRPLWHSWIRSRV